MKRHSKNMHGAQKDSPTACFKVSDPAATPTAAEMNPLLLENHIATLQASVLACSKEIESISTALSSLKTNLAKQGLAK